MTLSDIVFEMELNNIAQQDIDAIVLMSKEKGIMLEFIDDELAKRGYDKIFSVDYNDYDDWEDDEFSSVEKIRHKNHWVD